MSDLSRVLASRGELCSDRSHPVDGQVQSACVLPAPLAPYLLTGAMIVIATASAVAASVASQDASPLQPAFALSSSAHSYVATKSQWEAATTARSVAWAAAALSGTLLLMALAAGVVVNRRRRAQRKLA